VTNSNSPGNKVRLTEHNVFKNAPTISRRFFCVCERMCIVTLITTQTSTQRHFGPDLCLIFCDWTGKNENLNQAVICLTEATTGANYSRSY